MRIDSTHRRWLDATLTTLGLLTATFIVYAARSANGPAGGSLPGLLYGIAGYGLMIYAALLGLRKKVPVWRIGRAQTWMRGHLWMGSLSLALILFHCGFTWNGSLTTLLMWLSFLSVGSGLAGAILQHFIPKFLTLSVPLETIYDEIPHVRRQLCDEADALAATISGTGGAEDTLQAVIDPGERVRFAGIYAQDIRPMLLPQAGSRRKISIPDLAHKFDSLRNMLPDGVHAALLDLESICEEELQLRRQRRIHLWMHSWLLVHVPLSIALLVLGGVHAVMALRF